MSSEWLQVGARVRGAAADLGRRLFPFVELQLAMALGALACLLVGRVVRASPIYATDYRPGTVPYFLGDVFFLTVPVVIWMLIRGFGRRRSLELAVAMLSPVAAIVALGQLTGAAYLLWLVTAMYPAMSLGMLAYLLFRRSVFDRGRQRVSTQAS
jgi:uncharacterized protein (DUF2062 family)